jgi:hypothetical protein
MGVPLYRWMETSIWNQRPVQYEFNINELTTYIIYQIPVGMLVMT